MIVGEKNIIGKSNLRFDGLYEKPMMCIFESRQEFM